MPDTNDLARHYVPATRSDGNSRLPGEAIARVFADPKVKLAVAEPKIHGPKIGIEHPVPAALLR